MTHSDNTDHDSIIHRPSDAFVESTNIWAFMESHGIDDYDELIARTTGRIPGEPDAGIDWFWDILPEYLGIEFETDYAQVRDNSDGPQFTEWYPGGRLNIATNVLDRHANASETADEIACLWEGEPGEVREVTFAELSAQTKRVANFLDQHDIGQGDTVGLYMPMIPEVISILYGCFTVGAIAVPIFSGFGTDATATRIEDSACSVLFTADGFYRRGKEVHLKETVDDAITQAGYVEKTVIYNRMGERGKNLPWNDDRDVWWDDAIEGQDDSFDPVSVPSDHPAMLLYSSGTTGTPKGIVQTHAGALLQCAKEVYFSFDRKPGDRFFWVSDIGWMMGPWMLIGNHTFGGTVFMYEGAPDYPEPDRFWTMIDRHQITQFGISPTAIRALRKHGDEWVDEHDLSSLRILGSTGEPWDAESWLWFYRKIGNEQAPIINISGGTEIFGCFLIPQPIQPLKPCTLGGPGLGMAIDIVDRDGTSVTESHERGFLVARDSCPSMTKSLWSGDTRYLEEYWSTWDDLWDHGDWAQMDEDGFWFLHGRADDALNVAGRKVGPAEVEGAAMKHDAVSQAAAVGAPDETTGTVIVLYVILEPGVAESDECRASIRQIVGEELGKPFRPREVLFVDRFPKTQSGKIVRRAIEQTYRGEDPGDLSSIEDRSALDDVASAR